MADVKEFVLKTMIKRRNYYHKEFLDIRAFCKKCANADEVLELKSFERAHNFDDKDFDDYVDIYVQRLTKEEGERYKNLLDQLGY